MSPYFLEMSAGFTSYIVQTTHIYFIIMLETLVRPLFFDLIIFSVLRQTVAYAFSIHKSYTGESFLRFVIIHLSARIFEILPRYYSLSHALFYILRLSLSM
jgi:hypothetical protein